MEITRKQYMAKQPRPEKETPADEFYYALAGRLAALWDNSHLLTNWPEPVRRAVVLGVVGYYQDVVADAGLWRSFTAMHEELYGTPLPFYGRSEDYIDYELNLDDVRFIIWYTADGLTGAKMQLSPLDERVLRLARLWFKALDERYEEAPSPVELNMAVGVDPTDVEDASNIYDLSRWLFFNSYLMPPAASRVIARQMMDAMELTKQRHRDLEEKIRDLEDRTMLSNTCGPLALEIGQWVEAIATGKNTIKGEAKQDEPHKLYTQLVQATGGSEIAFFPSYGQLERFLVKYMRWKADEGGIFPQLRHSKNLVLLANHNRGMLVAPDVAQYIAHPANPCYNAQAAKQEAHTLVTQQGRCPVDLVRYLFASELLPDAVLPSDTTGRLLHNNWDFLVRLYLQQGPIED